MKRKLLIFSALISLLLAGFQFPIYADEDSSDSSSAVPIPNSIRLDQYFYDNYELLPYIETSGAQKIDTGIKSSSSLKYEIKISDILNTSYGYIFAGRNGIRANDYSISVSINSNNKINNIYYYNQNEYFTSSNYPYVVYNYLADQGNFYINGSLIKTFEYTEFNSQNNVYLFANPSSDTNFLSAKIYNVYIYDYSSDSYVRYYYPAKTKSGGVIGLYDAVSDTFVTTSGSVPFVSPVNDQVLNFQISDFVTSSLVWIGDILEFAVETPIIMVFMAIGLAGAMFRWGRRLVHF